MKKRAKKRQNKKSKKDNKTIYNILIRYFIAIFLSINSLAIFYYIFRPLTFFPAVLILKLIYSAQAFGIEKILIQGKEILFIESCVAGSAYYLFALLNLTTFGLKWKDRIRIFLVNSIALLCANILRIIILAVILINATQIFDTTHFIFWNLISTIFVAGIWILTVKFYKIKHIPIISDISYILKIIKKN